MQISLMTKKSHVISPHLPLQKKRKETLTQPKHILRVCYWKVVSSRMQDDVLGL